MKLHDLLICKHLALCTACRLSTSDKEMPNHCGRHLKAHKKFINKFIKCLEELRGIEI